jgi:PAS domain S-box-containing protein
MTDEEKITGETPYEIAYLRVLVADLENRNRQTEDLMRIVTEQYRRITEVVSDYIFSVHIIDGNPVETVHGRGCLAVTGYSPEEFVASSMLWINMVFEDDRALVLKHVSGILSGKDTAPFEHRIVRKDGAVRWVRNTPVCQFDTSGKLLAYDGLIEDVTERRQSEETLQKSEQKYRIIADFTYDWEEWLGPDKHYIFVSPSCQRVTGYRQEDFITDPSLVTAIAHPADRALVADHYRKFENSPAEPQQLDFRIITRTGDERWISHRCQPVFSEDGDWLGRRASNHDISRRRKLTEELLKAREMEAVGILAGGIAHDFNNLITAILGNISIAKMNIKPEDKIYSLLTKAEESSLRTRDLTRQLIVFSRRGAPVKKELSVGEMLRKIALTERNGNGIRFKYIIPESLWPIEADEGQLSLAVRSLIINAREAIGENGLITISSDNLTVMDRDKLEIPPGDYVGISVRDTGVGIPAENITRIFDPYFTTKDAGPQKGIGLGLAIAYSIVTNHDGIITAESESGEGTTMHVFLPAVKHDQANQLMGLKVDE